MRALIIEDEVRLADTLRDLLELNGWTAERDAAEREKILTANKDSLLLAADIIEQAEKSSSEAVVTGERTARELRARGFTVISPEKA